MLHVLYISIKLKNFLNFVNFICTTESLRVPQAWFYFLLGWDSLELSLTLEHGPYSRMWFLQAFLGLK